MKHEEPMKQPGKEIEVTQNGQLYKMQLPDIEVRTRMECRLEVTVDAHPMDIIFAVQYLLADRERIKTELADLREKVHRTEESTDD